MTTQFRARPRAAVRGTTAGGNRAAECNPELSALAALSSGPTPDAMRATSRHLGRVVAACLMPVTDALALTVAVAVVARTSVLVVGYVLAVLTVLAVGGQHRLRICARVSDQAGRIVAATSVPLLVLLLISPRASSAWQLAIAAPGCVLALRALAYFALGIAHRRDVLTEPTLVVGTSEQGVQLAELMRAHPELGLRPLGFLDDCDQENELPLPLLGDLTDLPAIARRFSVRRVVVCPSARVSADGDRDMVAALRVCRRLPVDICVVPSLPELGSAVPRSCMDELWAIPLVPVRRIGSATLLLKRTFDVLAALLLLCLLTPLLVLLGAAIRVRDGRPVLFRQVRVTGNDRLAEILKLRTLPWHSDSDTRWGVPTEGSTGLGRWLRASHLDELPQLANVLRGDMSLVGPRPERPYFVTYFSDVIPGYKDRTRMRAGLTGWAQVHGLHGDTSMSDRVRFDNSYIEHWSPWLDVVILVRTLVRAVAAGWVGKQ